MKTEIQTFYVTNSDELVIPYCKHIEAVAIDGVALPHFVKHTLPANEPDGEPTTHKFFNYSLETNTSGANTLVRGPSSNDGKWLVGSRIDITADWTPEKDAKA